jgi:hypothetical protein
MKTKRAGVRSILNQVRQRDDRSSLFHFMVEHHDRLVGEAAGGKFIWPKLCLTFAALGLTNQKGEPTNEETARKTWQRARREVAEKRTRVARAALTGLAPRSLMPSASPGARTPIENTRLPSSTAPETNTASAIPLPNIGSDASARAGGPISDEQVAAKKARMMRTLAERSGR